MKKTILTLLLLTILTGTVTAAVGMHPGDNTGQTHAAQITQGEITNQTLADKLSSLLLSFSGIQNIYDPGETIEGEVEVDIKQDFETEGADKVVKLYKCADSSCDTPPEPFNGEDCSREQYWPDGDDCIAKSVDTVPFSYTQEAGTTWTWPVEFSGRDDESHYIFVAAIWKDGNVVTSIEKELFQVEDSSTDDSDGSDDTTDEDSGSPNIQAYQEPDLSVNHDTGEISGTVYLENTGDSDMQETNIVEMQVKTGNDEFLSFISSQNTCDPDSPENVHKTYRIDAGDQVKINLESQIESDGDEYDIVFLTATDCMVDGDGEFVEPYNGRSGEYRFNNVQIGEKDEESPGDGGTTDPVDEGGTDRLPVILLALGAGFIGVVLYRRF